MSTGPLATLAQADFFTTTHRISGQVQTGLKPLCDLLNDRSLSYVLATNVYVSRLQEPGEIGAHISVAYLPKDNLSFLIVLAREARLGERGRLAVQEYKALVTLPEFEIRGTFLGPRRLDAQAFSPVTLDPFVVLTGATATMVSLPDVTFHGEVILVNRARLESFGWSE